MFTSPTTVPAYQRVADELREKILSGDMQPGQRIASEQELCETYAIGRSTAREALRTLASEQLVVTGRGVAGGTFVGDPNLDGLVGRMATGLRFMTRTEAVSVDEILEARETLELPAVGMAAERHTQTQMGKLASTIPPHRGHVEPPLAVNWSFHAVLLQMAGNRLLEMMTRPIFEVLRTRFPHRELPPEHWESIDDDHRRIEAAIRSRDRSAAEHHMRAHLQQVRATYQRLAGE